MTINKKFFFGLLTTFLLITSMFLALFFSIFGLSGFVNQKKSNNNESLISKSFILNENNDLDNIEIRLENNYEKDDNDLFAISTENNTDNLKNLETSKSSSSKKNDQVYDSYQNKDEKYVFGYFSQNNFPDSGNEFSFYVSSFSEIESFQLKFIHPSIIKNVNLNPIFDAVLNNSLTDNDLTIAASKLNNLSKLNLLKNDKGDVQLFSVTLFQNSNVDKLSLSQDFQNIIVLDNQEYLYLYLKI